jgi:glycosyltransferase involved in cell wall biosynthesis
VIAPATAEGFAAAIAALLNDPAHAKVMGAKGPAWVAAHRDYAVISQAVAALYDRLLAKRRR